MRRELGRAARALMHRRSYRRLGFVRLGDYARERLGVSARTLQGAAWLATRLDALPAISCAYDRSELSWARARAICKVAVAADEERWLALARDATVEILERLVLRARRPDGVPPDPEGEPNAIDGEPAVRWRFACPARVRALWRRALQLASRAAGERLADWQAAEIVAAEGSSGRPAGTSLGDRAMIAAIRMVRRAERVARDASDAESALPAGDDSSASSSASATCSAATGHDHASAPSPRHSPAGKSCPGAAIPSDRKWRALTCDREACGLLEPEAPSDPVALDARLVATMRVLRTIEPRIGRSLRIVVDQRLHRVLGYPAFDGYVRERLGLSVRKAWALLAIEKVADRSPDFGSAYREGRLSWIRALSLLPVIDRATAPAWIARAEAVTVRRLCDEVDWVLERRDALGPSVSLAPPPIDSLLRPPTVVAPGGECHDSSPEARLHVGASGTPPAAVAEECRDSSPEAELQIGASGDPRATAAGERRESSPPAGTVGAAALTAGERRAGSEVCDAEVRFTGPASVVALLRDVLDAFADPGEPRWTALERLLRHVITYWESTPRHRDPVFDRDGWRCTVPACSSRRNLHDHHIRFRSRGGGHTRDNRTVVCAAHHLHGIHEGTIVATGIAPHAIEWRLGVRPGAPPFLTCVGDRYVPDETFFRDRQP